jgi:hypothetical protein
VRKAETAALPHLTRRGKRNEPAALISALSKSPRSDHNFLLENNGSENDFTEL